MTLLAFASSLVAFSSFVFFGVEPTRGSWCQGHRLENTWNKRVALCLGAIPLWSFLHSFSAFQGSSMIIKCHLCLPFEEHEMTITCKNKISRKCPSTSNKHVLICAPMSASPTSKFQFQYGNLCFQYTHIYIYFYPWGTVSVNFPSFLSAVSETSLKSWDNHFARFFCAVRVVVAVAGWLWLVGCC